MAGRRRLRADRARPTWAGVIALSPLIFFRFLMAATVLEAILPLRFLAAHALARYQAGAAPAAGGFVMIGMGTRRFVAAGTNIVLVAPLLWVMSAVAREERYLERKFGDSYRAYKAQVRRWV